MKKRINPYWIAWTLAGVSGWNIAEYLYYGGITPLIGAGCFFAGAIVLGVILACRETRK
jgi:hypothetical protein